MEFHFYALTILLIWLHVAAITALSGFLIGSWALGRGAGILVIVMAAFAAEHYVGFGSLNGIWVLTTVASAAYLWKKWPQLKAAGFIKGELIFGIAFVYGLFWKFCFPEIFPSAERVTDMYFVGTFYAGTVLPPMDNWFPPHFFDFYYPLQHYGAALVGRAFQLPPGLMCNICFALLMALPLPIVWEFSGRFIAKRGPKLLLMAALVCGGTGASIFTPLIFHPADNLSSQAMVDVALGRMWGSARFIGHYDQIANTDFGRALLPKPSLDSATQDLPLENYGYEYFVGDYHPPLGGFFLLLLAIGLIMSLETGIESLGKSAALRQQFLLAFTVPATFATNTWIYPLHLAMVLGWVLWHQWQTRGEPSRKLSWPALVAGAASSFVLLYPFITYFTLRTLDIPIERVGSHTPLIPFLIQMWPLLILTALALFVPGMRKLAVFFALIFAGLFLFTEFFYVNDPSGGVFVRTNSTMKWWGWIWTGALVAIGAPLLGAKQRWVRGLTIFALAGTLVYAVQTVQFLHVSNMYYFGKLTGDGVYTRDVAVLDLFHYLDQAPRGIVMENLPTEAYNEGGVYATFAAKPVLLGWPAHEVTWRGKMKEIADRRDHIRAFYVGTLENPLKWLKDNDVRYIIWKRNDAVAADVWQHWMTVLDEAYVWHGFGKVDGLEIGLWERRK